ncbi:SAM-dependent methyltransferase [Streptomyces calidiresistens]|uniref:SAM-dependent methyltransferase n=1 Tax=Streptomyces calidiresistens TaxID=1485586 RepID=A0A7W3XW10_9ACTN|nr:SAM-dependent methyltransferase [Streptomyces calidiresistens]
MFLREFLRHPHRTASVVPSSTALAERMAVTIPERGEPVVVELGPGTGAFTGVIRERLAGRGRQLAVESNPDLAAHLARRFPDVEVIVGGAAHLAELLAPYGARPDSGPEEGERRGTGGVDVLISGLPWSAYTGPAGGALPRVMASVLAPDGSCTQFGYAWSRWTPPARHRLAGLRAAFGEVVVGRTVWRNLPPALVLHARRPTRAAGVQHSRFTPRAGATVRPR